MEKRARAQEERQLLLRAEQEARERAEAARASAAGAEQRLRASRDQLDAALREWDAFISVAAHELTTPIISLKGQAQLQMQIYRRDGQFDATRLERGLRAIDQQSEKLA